MGPILLKKIICELSKLLTGALVKKVDQPGERTIIIRLFTGRDEKRLMISASPSFSRMHLTVERPENPPAPPRFAALLRSRLKNGVITGISVNDGEVVATITFKARETTYKLVVELTGKSANIILTDAEDIIIGSLKEYPEGSARVVTQGVRLTPLPPLPPDRTAKEAFAEKTPNTDDTWNESADAFYKSIDRDKGEIESRSRLGRILKKARKKAEKKLRNLSNDKDKAHVAIEGARMGELLLTDFRSLKRGAKEAVVMDYTKDPPEEVKVPLDPALSPNENIDRIFKRAKKSKTTLKVLAERMPEVEAELEYLDTLSYELEVAEDEEGFLLVEEALSKAGYIRAAQKDTKKKRKQQGAMKRAEPVSRLKTSVETGSIEMLVGKSGAGNDLLVKRYARPGDLWFHAQGAPGAHVLLRTDGMKDEAPIGAIEEAAREAAKRSRLGTSSKAEVIYTEAKNVKKPRGARPGMVSVDSYRSILVALDQ